MILINFNFPLKTKFFFHYELFFVRPIISILIFRFPINLFYMIFRSRLNFFKNTELNEVIFMRVLLCKDYNLIVIIVNMTKYTRLKLYTEIKNY